jgi:hypothetical protein
MSVYAMGCHRFNFGRVFKKRFYVAQVKNVLEDVTDTNTGVNRDKSRD